MAEGAFRLLHPRLREVIKDLGYVKPTLVQEKAIPIVLSDYHTLIIAPTGSGKTEAAVFPCISKILSKGLVGTEGIKLLYVTPLRALNRDLELRLRTILKRLGLKISIRHGDTPYSLRKLIERDFPDFLVTTPETLQYILINKRLREGLRSVRFVIIDELHELIDSKRGAELVASLERLVRVSGEFQRIALSASIGDPYIASKYFAYGRYVRIVDLGALRDTVVKVVIPGVDDLEHRLRLLAKEVPKHGSTLIFTNTRSDAEGLGLKLRELGTNVGVHHGSLDKKERLKVEKSLRSGALNGVVCTSSLELGIDIGTVDLVIQASSPRQVVKFVQRVGRSSHRIGEVAKGIIVTTYNLDDILESIAIALRSLRGNLETVKPYERPLDVLAHQVVGMALEYGRVSVDKIVSVLSGSYIFRLLPIGTLMELIKELESLRLIKVVNEGGKVFIEATKKGKIYYLTTTMIVESSQYDVIDVLTKRKIGFLDEKFIVLSCEEGAVISLGGNLWRVIAIDDDNKKVMVEPIYEASEVLIPSWEGNLIPVDYKVAREVCALRRLIFSHGCSYLDALSRKYGIRFSNLEFCKRLLEALNEYEVPPCDNNLVIELIRQGDELLLVFNTCLGSKGNAALGYLLTYLLTKSMRLGGSFELKYDPYRVMIHGVGVYRGLGRKDVEKLIDLLISCCSSRDDLINLLKEALRGSKLFNYRLYAVLRRVGIIGEDTPRNVVKALINEYSKTIFSTEAFNEIFTEDMDVDVVLDYVVKLSKGLIKVSIQEFKHVPKLTYSSFKRLGFTDKASLTILPPNVIAEVVKRRILSKRLMLICLVCGWSDVREVRYINNEFRCPKCGSRYIGITKVLDRGIVRLVRDILRKRKGLKELKDEEKRVIHELMESGNLFLTYGPIVTKVLAGLGIGPQTAKKILAKGFKSEFELWLRIFEHEKQFLKVSKYWN